MQRDFNLNFPSLDIQILGINEHFPEFDPGPANQEFSAGRITPWLQDVDADNNRVSDVWYDKWEITYRDVVVLDTDNEIVEIFNVTSDNLDSEENYSELRQAFIDNAVTPPATLWQNPVEPLDVDADQIISPIDAIIVINHLGEFPEGLPPPGDGIEMPPYLDVVGNRSLGPLDALLVINHLTDVSTSGSAALSDSGGTSIPNAQQPLGFVVSVNLGDAQATAARESSSRNEQGFATEDATDAVFADVEARFAEAAMTRRGLPSGSSAGAQDSPRGESGQLEDPLLVTSEPW